jgi:hypothetical protein
MLMHSIYHVILFTFCEGLRLNTILLSKKKEIEYNFIIFHALKHF